MNLIEELCSKIPVGKSGAIRLLNQSNNNLVKAIGLFNEKCMASVMKNIHIKENDSIILEHLIKNNYNIDKTQQSLLQLKYSLTERTLLMNKNQEKTLDIIAYSIEIENNLKRNFWLDLDDVKKINIFQQSVIIVMEWSNYESWENFDSAICWFDWTKEFISVLEKQLQLNEESINLQLALDICENYYSTTRKNQEFPSINSYEQSYHEAKAKIFDKLVTYIKENMNQFP